MTCASRVRKSGPVDWLSKLSSMFSKEENILVLAQPPESSDDVSQCSEFPEELAIRVSQMHATRAPNELVAAYESKSMCDNGDPNVRQTHPK